MAGEEAARGAGAAEAPVGVVRVVLVRFREANRTRADREAAALAAQAVFPRIPGVVSFRSGLPADEEAAQEWDLLLEVGFAAVEDVPAYREHPLHLDYVETHLRPRMEQLKARNFVLQPDRRGSEAAAGAAGAEGAAGATGVAGGARASGTGSGAAMG